MNNKLKFIAINLSWLILLPYSNLLGEISTTAYKCKVKHDKTYEKCPFVSQWLIMKPNTEIHLYFPEIIDLSNKLPVQYNFQINWGDETPPVQIRSNEDPLLEKNRFISHSYKNKGRYQIIISGIVPSIHACNHPENFKGKNEKSRYGDFIENMSLEHVLDLGDLGWKSFDYSFSNCLLLQSVAGGETSSVTSMMSMFANNIRLTNLDLSTFNTTQVENMESMFSDSYEISDLNLETFNTGNVTTMYNMFSGTKNLKQLNISSFKTDSVFSMDSMFDGAESLEELNLKHFNTAKTNSMSSMFKKMYALKKLDISSFDTSLVEDMSSMFYGLLSLTSLDLSHFKTDNLKNMAFMFAYTPLKSLNLSNFRTKKVENMSYLFGGEYSTLAYPNTGHPSLKEVDLSHFDFSSVSNLRGLAAGFTSVDNFRHLKTLDLSSLDLSKFKHPKLSEDEIKNYSKKNVDITKYFSNLKLIHTEATIYCHKNSKKNLDDSCSFKFTDGGGDYEGGPCNCVVKP